MATNKFDGTNCAELIGSRFKEYWESIMLVPVNQDMNTVFIECKML